jgi:hypothetical protein
VAVILTNDSQEYVAKYWLFAAFPVIFVEIYSVFGIFLRDGRCQQAGREEM